jgi:NitT/TauT family transport system permease protein
MNVVVHYLPIVILLASWEVITRLGLIDESIMPSLTGVVGFWWRFAAAGELWPHLAASLFRVVTGLTTSVLVGTACGILMAWSRGFRLALQPLVGLLFPLPKSALIPVLIIWLGFGHAALIGVIFLGCLLPVMLSAFNGATGVDRTLIWSAWSLGASQREIMRQVIVPAALPEILSGIRIALALSFVLLVGSEMLVARVGLGYLVSFLGESGNYDGMFAAVFTVAACGFVADRMYLAAMRRALRWREA